MSHSTKTSLKSAAAMALMAALPLAGCVTDGKAVHPPMTLNQRPAPELSEREVAERHLQAGRPGLAIVELTKALTHEPNSEVLFRMLGDAYEALGRHDIARGYLGQALASNPSSPETLYALGNSYYQQNAFTEAKGYFEKAITASTGPLHDAIRGRLMVLAEKAGPEPRADTGPTVAAAQPGAFSAFVVRTGEHTYELHSKPEADLPAPAPRQATDTAPRATSPAPALQPALQPALHKTHLEVSNGAGLRKLAARVSYFLSENGFSADRITNADNFAHATSVIYYRADAENEARELAKQLPVEVPLIQTDDGLAGIRLILGRDLFSFDKTLRAYLVETGHADLEA